MASDFSSIPLVDLGLVTGGNGEVDEARRKLLAEELCDHLKTVGFVYLKNHGVSQDKVENFHAVSKTFYELPETTKKKYKKIGLKSNGWVHIGMERQSGTTRPHDYKEAYGFYPWDPERVHTWPDVDCLEFQKIYMDLCNCCLDLAKNILFLLGLGLNPHDPEVFARHHNTREKRNATAARSIYYPPVPAMDSTTLLPEQLGCAEHTDYGCFTFIIQDETGGLEVKNRCGEFIPATPVPGTIVMNVADLLQRWTADHLVSTVHRVIVPRSASAKPRQSFAFFVHPDADHLVECYDGSEKYTPVKAENFTTNRYVYTFQKKE